MKPNRNGMEWNEIFYMRREPPGSEHCYYLFRYLYLLFSLLKWFINIENNIAHCVRCGLVVWAPYRSGRVFGCGAREIREAPCRTADHTLEMPISFRPQMLFNRFELSTKHWAMAFRNECVRHKFTFPFVLIIALMSKLMDSFRRQLVLGNIVSVMVYEGCWLTSREFSISTFAFIDGPSRAFPKYSNRTIRNWWRHIRTNHTPHACQLRIHLSFFSFSMSYDLFTSNARH